MLREQYRRTPAIQTMSLASWLPEHGPLSNVDQRGCSRGPVSSGYRAGNTRTSRFEAPLVTLADSRVAGGCKGAPLRALQVLQPIAMCSLCMSSLYCLPSRKAGLVITTHHAYHSIRFSDFAAAAVGCSAAAFLTTHQPAAGSVLGCGSLQRLAAPQPLPTDHAARPGLQWRSRS